MTIIRKTMVNENDALKYTLFSEGSYLVTENRYEYHIKDHLATCK